MLPVLRFSDVMNTPARSAARRHGLRLLAGLGLLAILLSSCILSEVHERYAIEIVTEGQAWDEPGLQNVADALSRLPDHVVRRLGNRYYGELQVLSNEDGEASDGWQPDAGRR